ncbi:MAG: hypothetical protein HY897_06450 [Deltaproteobacteria bacterium]|nr:hypothetical protein [Deltaproteobacteria bacterium]
MPIAIDETRTAARLAGLVTGEDEIAALASQLSTVIDHFASIRDIDTSDVPPTHLAFKVETPFRKDVPGDPLSAAAVFRAAPAKDGSRLTVPRAPSERSDG